MSSDRRLNFYSFYIIPLILLLGFYVQFHGEYTPGGGFQAGVISICAFVLFAFVSGFDKLKKALSFRALDAMCLIGVLFYFVTGLIPVFFGYNYLDYSFYANIINAKPVTGQKIGIMLVEIGVYITVFASTMRITYSFIEYLNRYEQK